MESHRLFPAPIQAFQPIDVLMSYFAIFIYTSEHFQHFIVNSLLPGRIQSEEE
jgi:hypothetical protein